MLTEMSTLDNFPKGRRKAMVFIFGQMGKYTKVSGVTASRKVRDFGRVLRVIVILGTGKTQKPMAGGDIIGLMEISMKETG